tara:strand:+ start:320 stop:787 length:468 start_codon:yes stop_codon:yes gene_type:complete
MANETVIQIVPNEGAVNPPRDDVISRLLSAVDIFNRTLDNDVVLKRANRILNRNLKKAEAGDEEAVDVVESAYENIRGRLGAIAETLGISVFFTAGGIFLTYSSYSIFMCNVGTTACLAAATGCVAAVATVASGVAAIVSLVGLLWAGYKLLRRK